MSKQDSESDINIDDTQDEQNSYTPETLQNDTTIHHKDDLIHDEYDTSEDENISEIETYEDYGEKIHETEESIPTQTSLNHQKKMGSKKLENKTNSLLPHFKLKLKTEKLKGS